MQDGHGAVEAANFVIVYCYAGCHYAVPSLKNVLWVAMPLKVLNSNTRFHKSRPYKQEPKKTASTRNHRIWGEKPSRAHSHRQRVLRAEYKRKNLDFSPDLGLSHHCREHKRRRKQ